MGANEAFDVLPYLNLYLLLLGIML